MTEEQWQACEDPAAMLNWLGLGASLHRCRQCKCLWRWHEAQRVWTLAPGESPHRCCDNAQMGTDEVSPRPIPLSDRQLRLWCAACCVLAHGKPLDGVYADWLKGYEASDEPDEPAIVARVWASDRADPFAPHACLLAQRAAALRCVAGFSFRPQAIDRLAPVQPRGRSLLAANPHIKALAREAWNRTPPTGWACRCGTYRDVYPSRCEDCGQSDTGYPRTLEPARLAVLSDALEEAGCANVRLLAHLRQPGLHVRGCWALDIVRGIVPDAKGE